MAYRAGEKVDRTPVRAKKPSAPLNMCLEVLDRIDTGDEEKQLAAKRIARWLMRNKERGTMTAKERAHVWHEVAGALGVLEHTDLIKDGT